MPLLRYENIEQACEMNRSIKVAVELLRSEGFVVSEPREEDEE